MVSEYVSEQHQQAEELDDMATGNFADDAAHAPAGDLTERGHQLLPLRCVVEAASVLVGVVVIERGEGQVDPEQQLQLLNLLAASLLEAG
jgi:hypothetical protein